LNQNQLVVEVTAAFKDELYPGDLSIVYDSSGLHLACIEIREAFKGHLWQDVPEDVLSTKQTGLSFMSKEGFKYYLPAFICSVIQNRSVVADGLNVMLMLLKLPTEIDTLIVEQSIELFKTPSNALNIALGDFLQKQLVSTNERLNNFFVRVSQFDEPQRQAICHFLVYVRDEHNEPSLKQEADLAIQRYWFQFE
jgi:hypothetical protein